MKTNQIIIALIIIALVGFGIYKTKSTKRTTEIAKYLDNWNDPNSTAESNQRFHSAVNQMSDQEKYVTFEILNGRAGGLSPQEQIIASQITTKYNIFT